MPKASLENETRYRDLRNEGGSKEKARISNAAAARGASSVGHKRAESGSDDDWTVPEPKKRTKERRLSGCSSLTQRKLSAKLRNHQGTGVRPCR